MLTKKERLKKLTKRFQQRIHPYKGNPTILFLGAEQRSGTNFLFNTLNQHPDIECYLENDDEAFSNYVLKNTRHIEKLNRKSRAKVVAYKSISDSQNIHYYFNHFPNSKAIWTFRLYNDVINSSLRNFSDHRKYLYYMLFEPEKAGWRLENVTPSDLQLVKYFYEKGIDDSSSRALIWYLRNSLFFQLGLNKNNRILMTKYEDLVMQPELYFSKIFDFLNIKSQKLSSHTAFTSSLNKNDPPEIDKEIKDICDTLYCQLQDHYVQQHTHTSDKLIAKNL